MNPIFTRQLVSVIAILVAARSFAADPSAAETNSSPKRLACVGDSITFGAGVRDRKKDSYPSQLGRLLGSAWEVRNFGVSGATLMKKGDRPYFLQAAFQSALDYKPDVVVIALGTNDSKPQNYERHPEDFVPSYKDLIAKFREASPGVKVYACLPVPAFPENYGIRDSIIAGNINPLIRQVAQEEHVTLIDLHAALAGKDGCFPDKIHPNEEGAGLIAQVVSQALSK